MSSKQAVFFVNHWPEPLSSAAGLRTRELTGFLQKLSYKIIGISPGSASEHSLSWEQSGVRTLSCDPNQSSIEEILRTLAPEIVLYDRFYMEEQFGWRARELWPKALHIVDTSDIHCIRRARQRAVGLQHSWRQVMSPDEDLFEDDILREMASLHRADITLVVSSYEEKWLIARGLESERILLLPFSAKVEIITKDFVTRKGFCFLGNYFHPPNLDAVKWLESELWPLVRQKLPDAELHLYGAYPPQIVSRHKGKDGIYSHGPVLDHRAALAKHLALVAPLRYGAGIKGKVLESWAVGTPVIGTPIAFEGITDSHVEFTTGETFVEEILRLSAEGNWQRSVAEGRQVLEERFNEELLFRKFSDFLLRAEAELPKTRASLTGRMLRHHGSQSVKYLSRWIEEKNKRQS